jgi:hypothetical protein
VKFIASAPAPAASKKPAAIANRLSISSCS